MKAPLIPGSRLRGWAIVHESGDLIPGFSGVVAFTTRAAFDAWVRGDIVIPQGEWLYGPPKSILSMEVALLTPNGEILILEEAWGWKFPTQCPKMLSAEDGRVVLGELLDGKHTPEQVFVRGLRWWDSFDQPTPEKLFVVASQARTDMETYQRLERWEADALGGPQGEVILLRNVDSDYVSLVGGGGCMTASLCGEKFFPNLLPLTPGDEMMVIERTNTSNHLWSPQEASRPAPMYLEALT